MSGSLLLPIKYRIGLDNRERYFVKYKKGELNMGTISEELAVKIESLPDIEKIELVDSILMQLDKPDPEIDRIWADEARKRWQAYKLGKLETVPYDQIMDKYRTR